MVTAQFIRCFVACVTEQSGLPSLRAIFSIVWWRAQFLTKRHGCSCMRRLPFADVQLLFAQGDSLFFVPFCVAHTERSPPQKYYPVDQNRHWVFAHLCCSSYRGTSLLRCTHYYTVSCRLSTFHILWTDSPPTTKCVCRFPLGMKQGLYHMLWLLYEYYCLGGSQSSVTSNVQSDCNVVRRPTVL